MEVTAAVRGLRALPQGAKARVHSDSSYVVNTMTKGWKRNANRDLWAELDAEVNAREVRWVWVKGHAGNPLNEEADRLARAEAAGEPVGQAPASPAPASAPPREPARAASAPSRSATQAASSPVPPDPPDSSAAASLPSALSHVDAEGAARMVDVGAKPHTRRVAVAQGAVIMRPETLRLIEDNAVEKGDVLALARVAGVMAAKKTADLIPLCHPLPLDYARVDFAFDRDTPALIITATAQATARTGVEMEALTAVSVAALTVYDMCKSADRAMRVDAVRLRKKSGGRSGDIALD